MRSAAQWWLLVMTQTTYERTRDPRAYSTHGPSCNASLRDTPGVLNARAKCILVDGPRCSRQPGPSWRQYTCQYYHTIQNSSLEIFVEGLERQEKYHLHSAKPHLIDTIPYGPVGVMQALDSTHLKMKRYSTYQATLPS